MLTNSKTLVTGDRLSLPVPFSQAHDSYSIRLRRRIRKGMSLTISIHLMGAAVAIAQPYTLGAEIELSHFGDRYTGSAERILLSPDRSHFAVYSERGNVERNEVEDSIRVYRMADVRSLWNHPKQHEELPPSWVFNAWGREGASISNWQWLQDSRGIVFLERAPNGAHRLMFADTAMKVITPLTASGENVLAYHANDENNFAYTVRDPNVAVSRSAEDTLPSRLATGRYIEELVLPHNDPVLNTLERGGLLYASLDGKRYQVNDRGAAVEIYGNSLALSPNGKWLVTDEVVNDIPYSWETLYPPPFQSSGYRVRSGKQRRDAIGGIRHYVLIDMRQGRLRSVTGAPQADGAGWFSLGTPSWSADSRYIVLPATFTSHPEGGPRRPCIAVADIESGLTHCVEYLKGRTNDGFERGYRAVRSVSFDGRNSARLKVNFRDRTDARLKEVVYERNRDAEWREVSTTLASDELKSDGIKVSIDEGFDTPPQLVAESKGTLRVLWNPNPQLRDYDLGNARVYQWRDSRGREWRGGLFEPRQETTHERYPLVIQTHGFRDYQFEPSGRYPTAMAARALVAAGFVVLQVDEDRCPSSTPEEAACALNGYESAIARLSADGLIDRDRVGIVGFSRTCLYAMHALTQSDVHFRAASITAGVMHSYLQYMHSVSDGDDGVTSDAEGSIGVPPFGAGLKDWLARSPTFNLDRVNTPLLVTAIGRSSVLSMWEPYAGLRRLRKPVEFQVLNSGEHVLTNPLVRQVSQGGTVDWFRFWLKGEEDTNPDKASQYTRWRALRAGASEVMDP